MKVAVTRGCDFIGSEIAKQIAEEDLLGVVFDFDAKEDGVKKIKYVKGNIFVQRKEFDSKSCDTIADMIKFKKALEFAPDKNDNKLRKTVKEKI